MALGIDQVGVKVRADLFKTFRMALVIGIGDGVEAVAITPRAADIFGRATPLRVNQARIEEALHGGINAPYLNGVLPTVPEVVEIVDRPGAGIFQDIDEARLAGIERPVWPIWIGHSPADAADAEFVEMVVGPAHGGLQYLVETVEPNVKRHLDPASDGGRNVIKGDFEFDNAVGCHAASLRCFYSSAQCMAGVRQPVLWQTGDTGVDVGGPALGTGVVQLCPDDQYVLGGGF